ncbi:HPr Serine kinase C-terminal domain superfamily [Nitrosococcus oceani AFC27]|uniref:Serine kinase n=2 Tax=Nitrosococcus oceani TaxID=1229 RepID=A0A0E2YZ92_9GAMM|nr:HPr Serine kinase C-terminal domain superfamily [Nitrosococcus oceani AFC27]KFI18271.1 serine kinase [Nitrosococcus oceani C-27]
MGTELRPLECCYKVRLQGVSDPNENKMTSHGVLLVIFDCGVLLTGENSVGKSSLALELIRRGHRLIADDAPLFQRTAAARLVGSCPHLLQDFLAVPGLGAINIRAIYGDQTIAAQHLLDLVIHLIPSKPIEPLTRNLGQWEQLNVKVPEITLPLMDTMQPATVIETAVQDHQLRIKGYDALLELQQRQQELLNPLSPR